MESTWSVFVNGKPKFNKANADWAMRVLRGAVGFKRLGRWHTHFPL